MTNIAVKFCIILAIIACVSGHTWLSCTKMVNGVCQGYIRNYRGRDTAPSGVDDFYTNKALGRPSGFSVCKSDTQQQKTYTDQYPMATAYAGQTLNVMYTPNGHSQNGDRGLQTTSRIHWSGSTSASLATREQLTDANKIGEWNYGANCATSGDVASLPCVNGFTVPAGAAPGIYQFVWYWPYDRDQNQRPLGEEYFSCFDVQVLATSGVAPANTTQTSQQQTSQQTSQQPTSQQTSQQTSQPASSTVAANPCASMLSDCKTFCGEATVTTCECDPITGKKNLHCGGDEQASGATSAVAIGMPVAILLAISSLL